MGVNPLLNQNRQTKKLQPKKQILKKDKILNKEELIQERKRERIKPNLIKMQYQLRKRIIHPHLQMTTLKEIFLKKPFSKKENNLITQELKKEREKIKKAQLYANIVQKVRKQCQRS